MSSTNYLWYYLIRFAPDLKKKTLHSINDNQIEISAPWRFGELCLRTCTHIRSMIGENKKDKTTTTDI